MVFSNVTPNGRSTQYVLLSGLPKPTDELQDVRHSVGQAFLAT